jgi:hypothetical protein
MTQSTATRQDLSFQVLGSPQQLILAGDMDDSPQAHIILQTIGAALQTKGGSWIIDASSIRITPEGIAAWHQMVSASLMQCKLH